MKLTLRDGKSFDQVTALQVRPAALYFWDADGKQQVVRALYFWDADGKQQVVRVDQVAALAGAELDALPELQLLPTP